MTTPSGSPVPPVAPVTITTNNVVIGIESIPTYDGQSSIEEFLSVIDETALLANWSDEQKVAIARLKLRNKAKQFIESEPTLQTTTAWTTLKDALKKQFMRQYVKGAAMKNFIECRQRNGETCRQFLTRLKLLANRTVTLTGIPATDSIIRTKLEQDVTTQFILGLLMPIKQRVLSANPKSLEEALKHAEMEESIENLIHPTTSKECRVVQNQNNRRIKQRPTNEENRRPAYGNQNIQRPFRCFKCNKEGHTSKYCPVTCFKCRKIGHFSRDCPENDTQRNRTQAPRLCYRCQQPGHIARFCPQMEDRRQPRNSALNYSTVAQQPRTTAVQEARWD